MVKQTVPGNLAPIVWIGLSQTSSTLCLDAATQLDPLSLVGKNTPWTVSN